MNWWGSLEVKDDVGGKTMDTDENSKEVVKEKPQIYFKNIRFNDDTELILEKIV